MKKLLVLILFVSLAVSSFAQRKGYVTLEELKMLASSSPEKFKEFAKARGFKVIAESVEDAGVHYRYISQSYEGDGMQNHLTLVVMNEHWQDNLSNYVSFATTNKKYFYSLKNIFLKEGFISKGVNMTFTQYTKGNQVIETQDEYTEASYYQLIYYDPVSRSYPK
ncbi:MAG: hypothetical protein ABIN95_11325 [Mucilaginibacter sp.]